MLYFIHLSIFFSCVVTVIEECVLSNLLRDLSRIPCAELQDKQQKGWIRRKRLEHEPSSNKWIKCWMVLCSGVLYIYQNQYVGELFNTSLYFSIFWVETVLNLREEILNPLQIYRFLQVQDKQFYVVASSSLEENHLSYFFRHCKRTL